MSNTPRPPLLSDRLLSIIASLEGNVSEWVIDDLLAIHDELEIYEDLITDAKLRVEEEVELIQAEPLVPMWFCSHCDWRNAPSHYTFCPGCGNKIKR